MPSDPDGFLYWHRPLRSRGCTTQPTSQLQEVANCSFQCYFKEHDTLPRGIVEAGSWWYAGSQSLRRRHLELEAVTNVVHVLLEDEREVFLKRNCLHDGLPRQDSRPSPAQHAARVLCRWSSFPLLSPPGMDPRACSGDVSPRRCPCASDQKVVDKAQSTATLVACPIGSIASLATGVINTIDANTKGLNEIQRCRKTRPAGTDRGMHRLHARQSDMPSKVSYTVTATGADPDDDAVADVSGQWREYYRLSTTEQISLELGTLRENCELMQKCAGAPLAADRSVNG